MAFELDSGLLAPLAQTLAAAKSACEDLNVAVTWDIRHEDFVAGASKALTKLGPREVFDVAIMNPPYRKIRSDSEWRSLLRAVGIETSNLYSAFVTLALRLLAKQGELIAITPRSFCNGPYFKPFRRELLRSIDLKRVHVFEARDRAFADDEVLQENVIIHGLKGSRQGARVTISSSVHPTAPEMTSRSVAFGTVVHKNDREYFIHLVPNRLGQSTAVRSRNMPAVLADLGLSVSTGRVVDFRARHFLAESSSPGAVPLIYPRHFAAGFVEWPKPHKKKADAILSNATEAQLLVPSGIYVLVKRFSAKEELRRVVAAVFDPKLVPCSVVGFENHLNYFHRNGGPIPRILALGLAAYLNSSFLDEHFRQFSGHTQVNATDLRNLRYPTLGALEELGRRFASGFPDQARLDVDLEALLAVEAVPFPSELQLAD